MAAPLIFSTESYEYLARAIAVEAAAERGSVERKIFPDGERYLRVTTPVDQRDVVLVGGTISDADTLELYDLASGLVQCGAATLTIAIPYFAYSTMERPVKPGEVVTAKVRARLLSSLPPAINGMRILLLDLHAEGIPFYFEGAIHTQHLYAKKLVIEAARAMHGKDLVMACTDAGRAKWVESLANDLGVPASFVFKRRIDGHRTEITGVSALVSRQNVIIYDDMIRTGSSLLNAARAYRDAGAASVAAITTHGIFPGDALQKIKSSGLLERIVCTDSHPNALKLQGDFLKVISLSGLFAEAIRR
ncbi:MAG TPA: ribose-phosphate diphosphokinase [Planctomycetota bacterium]|nr:ribose-phosphate diphosphokinase [Planctomycetota bacterium]